MGWLRSVGSIKLQVSFAEYRLFYRALLQKRPIIQLILLTEAVILLISHYMQVLAVVRGTYEHIVEAPMTQNEVVEYVSNTYATYATYVQAPMKGSYK